MTTLVVTGDILKTPNANLIGITAPKGTKIGQLIEYPLRKKHLIALSDEENGKVLVAPHNCVIDLSRVALSDITTAGQTLDKLQEDGDAYGIIYQGMPI